MYATLNGLTKSGIPKVILSVIFLNNCIEKNICNELFTGCEYIF